MSRYFQSFTQYSSRTFIYYLVFGFVLLPNFCTQCDAAAAAAAECHTITTIRVWTTNIKCMIRMFTYCSLYFHCLQITWWISSFYFFLLHLCWLVDWFVGRNKPINAHEIIENYHLLDIFFPIYFSLSLSFFFSSAFVFLNGFSTSHTQVRTHQVTLSVVAINREKKKNIVSIEITSNWKKNEKKIIEFKCR